MFKLFLSHAHRVPKCLDMSFHLLDHAVSVVGAEIKLAKLRIPESRGGINRQSQSRELALI